MPFFVDMDDPQYDLSFAHPHPEQCRTHPDLAVVHKHIPGNAAPTQTFTDAQAMYEMTVAVNEGLILISSTNTRVSLHLTRKFAVELGGGDRTLSVAVFSGPSEAQHVDIDSLLTAASGHEAMRPIIAQSKTQIKSKCIHATMDIDSLVHDTYHDLAATNFAVNKVMDYSIGTSKIKDRGEDMHLRRFIDPKTRFMIKVGWITKSSVLTSKSSDVIIYAL